MTTLPHERVGGTSTGSSLEWGKGRSILAPPGRGARVRPDLEFVALPSGVEVPSLPLRAAGEEDDERQDHDALKQGESPGVSPAVSQGILDGNLRRGDEDSQLIHKSRKMVASSFGKMRENIRPASVKCLLVSAT